MSESGSNAPVELTLRSVEGYSTHADQEVSPGRVISVVFTFLKKNSLAVLVLGVPIVLSLFYEGFIASDLYVSESHFIVRSKAMSGSLNGLSDTSSLQPLSSMSQSNDYTQVVNDYLMSRDVLEELLTKDRFLEVISRPEGDFLTRFPRLGVPFTIEALYRRIDDFLYADFDNSTGISAFYVYAFRPDDAQRIARAAMEHAESLINRLNGRQQKDSIAFAQDMVEKAREKVRGAEQKITDFRNREGLFDPIREGAAVIALISKLDGDIAQLKAELSEVNISSPGSPKVASIKARIAAIEQQISLQRALLAGEGHSLAPKLAAYEKLMLDREMAVKTFSSALLLLEGAIRDMDTQRLYLERVVEPNLPDYALYPRRMRVLLLMLGFLVCIYWILKMAGEAILEHKQ
jgi:capsular polysaccharide transport system permease protein